MKVKGLSIFEADVWGMPEYRPGVYFILNKSNGKVYVGKSVSVLGRLQEHACRLIRGNHQNKHLQNDYDKYGSDRFFIGVFEYCFRHEIGVKESFWANVAGEDRLYNYQGFQQTPAMLVNLLRTDYIRYNGCHLTGNKKYAASCEPEIVYRSDYLQCDNSDNPLHTLRLKNNRQMSTLREMTAEQIAKSEGVTVDAVRARWNDLRETMPELFAVSFARNIPLSEAQESALRSAKSAKKKTGTVRAKTADKPEAAQGTTARPNEIATPATVKENLTTPPLFNPAYLKAIIYGHAGLIFADLVILYGVPGAIAGLLVGFFMHSSVSLADRPELNRTSAFALWICFGLDGLAWFVHVPAFRDSVSADVSDLVTQFLAGVVCAMSFAALYALRDSKLD